MALATAISTAISTASTHGIPRQAAVQRKDPRQCPRDGGGHGIRRGSCRGTSVLVAMVGTTEVATDRTAARAMATTVALAVEAPCTTESRGPCRGNPPISTVARGKTHGRPRKCHGHCRGPPPKYQIMCICGRSFIARIFQLFLPLSTRVDPGYRRSQQLTLF